MAENFFSKCLRPLPEVVDAPVPNPAADDAEPCSRVADEDEDEEDA